MSIVHEPVMVEEVLTGLNIKKSGVYVDATVGLGGHAIEILKREPECNLIGVDQDDQALNIARKRLENYQNVHLIRDDFSHLKEVITAFGCEKVQGILFDLGLSTLQIKDQRRGFSFLSDDPLDMRMDIRQEMTAGMIVNQYSVQKLVDVIWKYGEEKRSRKIARAIVHARAKKTIQSCSELSLIIEKAVGRRGRIHPATRTFQALRIEVNRELEKLSGALSEGADVLDHNGRFCVLSYHSLEDRIVKHSFRKLAAEGLFHLITKKPMVPTKDEKQRNPSARSAKLRIAAKI